MYNAAHILNVLPLAKELGCGCALVGLLAGELGASCVTLTDCKDEALAHLRNTVQQVREETDDGRPVGMHGLIMLLDMV